MPSAPFDRIKELTPHRRSPSPRSDSGLLFQVNLPVGVGFVLSFTLVLELLKTGPYLTLLSHLSTQNRAASEKMLKGC
jgi:hypothetical protein